MLKWCWTCWSETTHLLCLLTCACGIEKQKQTWRTMMIDQRRFNFRLRLLKLNPGMVFKYRSFKTWTEVRWLKLFVNMQRCRLRREKEEETCCFNCYALKLYSISRFLTSTWMNKKFQKVWYLMSVDFVRHFLSKKLLLFPSLNNVTLCLYLTFSSYFKLNTNYWLDI